MEIHLNGKQSIYEEIAAEYERFIRLGVLEEGERLPGVRVLAMQLGINPNTVERAYALLEKRGFVIILPKKGAFVKENRDHPPLVEEARSHVAALKAARLSKQELLAVVEEVYGGKGDGA